jgi:hypothetical protein
MLSLVVAAGRAKHLSQQDPRLERRQFSPPIAEISLSEERYLEMRLRVFRSLIGWRDRSSRAVVWNAKDNKLERPSQISRPRRR